MKAKTLLPLVAFCLAGPVGTGYLRADHMPGHHGKSITMSGKPLILSEVMDACVKDAQGDDLGKIKDVVLDSTTGKPTFAIIQLSGTVGPDGKYTPVPWALLRPVGFDQSGEPREFKLNVDRDQFASQKFYLQTWPDYNQATWGPQVYSYYGCDCNGVNFSSGGVGPSIEENTGTVDYIIYPDANRHGPTRVNGLPIDNGFAPDGKGTFIRGPHWY